ncbi:MAG: 3'-5' exonuclease [Thermomicrobiales bacterium]|nr:3'-5' exonuclease [Thermomicrobiales bacterium]
MLLRVTPPHTQSGDEHRRNARAAATAWATAIAARNDVVFLDTETTGLDGRAEIIEIAVTDMAGQPLLDTLVCPDNPIPNDATRIHGITNRMVVAAPKWPQVYAQLTPLIAGRTVIVYNADFDRRLVQQMNQRFRLHMSNDDWQCAMKQYSQFAGVWHERYGGYRWHKLDAAAEAFGLSAGGHRALGDALACRAVVCGMAASASERDDDRADAHALRRITTRLQRLTGRDPYN